MYAAWLVPRLEELLVHPDVVAVVARVGVLAVLPVGAPAAVRSVGDVDDALALAVVVAVVVDADEVAVLVERELLQVPDARGEHLEAAAVQLGAQDGALARIGPALAALVDDVEADVADFPVEPSVRTDGHAGDAVAAERHMRVVAVADRRLAIDDAVAVRVAQAVDAGRHAEEQVAAVGQDAAADVPGRVLVEAFLHHPRGVGDAVAVGVLQPDDPLLELREIADVARAVLVEVGDPGVARALGRREILLVELRSASVVFSVWTIGSQSAWPRMSSGRFARLELIT